MPATTQPDTGRPLVIWISVDAVELLQLRLASSVPARACSWSCASCRCDTGVMTGYWGPGRPGRPGNPDIHRRQRRQRPAVAARPPSPTATSGRGTPSTGTAYPPPSSTGTPPSRSARSTTSPELPGPSCRSPGPAAVRRRIRPAPDVPARLRSFADADGLTNPATILPALRQPVLHDPEPLHWLEHIRPDLGRAL